MIDHGAVPMSTDRQDQVAISTTATTTVNTEYRRTKLFRAITGRNRKQAAIRTGVVRVDITDRRNTQSSVYILERAVGKATRVERMRVAVAPAN
ncbi:hypothetical protein A2U01_0010242 [Trifolium medium]|uniref:Uncharacterized protein n=1 Tax=Trifolium medium TaxID=97028 RepID=A0A392MPF5_9FABA|nr:hypothetical protein [Trifolium medium]